MKNWWEISTDSPKNDKGFPEKTQVNQVTITSVGANFYTPGAGKYQIYPIKVLAHDNKSYDAKFFVQAGKQAPVSGNYEGLEACGSTYQGKFEVTFSYKWKPDVGLLKGNVNKYDNVSIERQSAIKSAVSYIVEAAKSEVLSKEKSIEMLRSTNVIKIAEIFAKFIASRPATASPPPATASPPPAPASPPPATASPPPAPTSPPPAPASPPPVVPESNMTNSKAPYDFEDDIPF